MEGIKKRSLKSYELFLYFVFLAGKKKFDRIFVVERKK